MSKLVRLRYYQNAIEANRDKQLLAEYSIESYIANEQTVQSDWLLTQALGGIQLQVFENDLAEAEQILTSFNQQQDAALEADHTISNPEFDFVCPKCSSNHLYRDENPGGLFGISLLFLGIPLKTPSKTYHCYHCGHTFTH